MRKTMVVCAMACALAGAARAQKVEKVDIIMATLAPTDSQWYKVMENMGAEWKKISNGNVNLSIRAGCATQKWQIARVPFLWHVSECFDTLSVRRPPLYAEFSAGVGS